MTFDFKHTVGDGVAITIKSAQEIPLSSPIWGQLERIISNLNEISPDKVTFDSALGEYEVKLTDGRKWKQTITFGSPPNADPPMTFDVDDAWRASEFVRQRAMRDLIVSLVVTHGLTELKCDWP